MTSRALVVLACSAALVGLSPRSTDERPSGTTAAVQEGDSLTRRYDIAGLTVIHRFAPESEVVAVNLYLLGGARQVSEHTAGLEPLLLRASEHGTEHYPGGAARHALARTGSWTFVDPTEDWTVFGVRGLAVTFDSTWAVFADRVMHPTLDTVAVEIERAKMVASAKARAADPDESVRSLAEKTALQDHPYSVDVRGTEASLSRIGIDDLQAYLAEHMVKSRLLLVVVGNVPLERLQNAVEASLGQLPEGDYVWEMPPSGILGEPSVTAEYRAIPTEYILGYFGGPLASGEDHTAFRMAVSALSALISNGARDKGLSYAGRAFFFDRAASSGGIYFSTDRPKDCIDLVNESIETLRDARFSRSALRDYARSSVIDYHLQSETSGEQADIIGRAFLFRGVLPSPEQHVAEYMEVAPWELSVAAREYLKNIHYAVLGDTTNIPRKEMTKH